MDLSNTHVLLYSFGLFGKMVQPFPEGVCLCKAIANWCATFHSGRMATQNVTSMLWQRRQCSCS